MARKKKSKADRTRELEERIETGRLLNGMSSAMWVDKKFGCEILGIVANICRRGLEKGLRAALIARNVRDPVARPPRGELHFMVSWLKHPDRTEHEAAVAMGPAAEAKYTLAHEQAHTGIVLHDSDESEAEEFFASGETEEEHEKKNGTE